MPKGSKRRGRPPGSKGTKKVVRREPYGTSVMKKVGKVGAYKKQVKTQMMLRRAPIVETKQRVHSDIALINGHLPDGSNAINPLNFRVLLPDDAFSILNLESYYRMTQGLQEYQCVGNSIFSKYLNLKTEFRFPTGRDTITLTDNKGESYTAQNAMIEESTKLYLICGYVTESWNTPLNATPSPSLPAQAAATQADLKAYLTQQLKPFFDDDEDKLQFRPKQTTNIKIESYRRIKPSNMDQISVQAQGPQIWTPSGNPVPQNLIAATGSIPNVFKSHSWRTMKKIALTKGADEDAGNYPVDKENLFSNNGWLPFAIIYNPNYENQLGAVSNLTHPDSPYQPDASDPNYNPILPDGRFSRVQYIEYRHNDAHYYTDS